MRVYVLLRDWENYSEKTMGEFIGVYFSIEPLVHKLEECAKRHNVSVEDMDFSDLEEEVSHLETNQYSKFFIDIEPANKFEWSYQYYVQCCDAI